MRNHGHDPAPDPGDRVIDHEHVVHLVGEVDDYLALWRRACEPHLGNFRAWPEFRRTITFESATCLGCLAADPSESDPRNHYPSNRRSG